MLSAILAEARQLRQVCSPTDPSPLPPKPISIPVFPSTSPPDISTDLRTLGLSIPLSDNLQNLYSHYLGLHRQRIESFYSQTAQQLQSPSAQHPDLSETLPSNLALLLQTFLHKYERFAQDRKAALLREVSTRLARQRGCQPDRPVQLGKSFSKVRLLSSRLVATPLADLLIFPLISLSPPTPFRNPSSSSAKSTTKTPTPIRPSFERSPPMSVWTTSSVESGFVFPSLVSVLLSPDNHLAYDPVALSTARSLPSITPWLTLPRSSLSSLVLFVPFGFDDATYSSKTAATVNPVPRPTPSSTRLSPPPPPRRPKARRPHSRAKVVRPRRPSRAVARARLRTASVKEEAMGTRR
jgi:hypothetical protein